MSYVSFSKSPIAVLDYKIDWSDWLGIDTISTSTWTFPTGITKDSDSKTNTTTTAWVSGGTEGKSYLLVNKIVTAGGRTEQKTIEIVINSR
jgi:hypothetical protein